MYTHRVGVCLFCSRVNCTVSTHIGHTPMVSSCLVWVLLLVLAPKFLCGATSFNNTIEATCSYVGLVVGQLVGAGMRSRAALEPKKSSRGCAPAPRLTVPSALRAANPSALLSRPVDGGEVSTPHARCARPRVLFAAVIVVRETPASLELVPGRGVEAWPIPTVEPPTRSCAANEGA